VAVNWIKKLNLLLNPNLFSVIAIVISLVALGVTIYQTFTPGAVTVSAPVYRVGITRAKISGNRGDKILLNVLFHNSGNSFKVVKDVRLRLYEKDQNCNLDGDVGYFRLQADGTFEKLLNVPLDESPMNIPGYSRVAGFALERDNSYATNFLFFPENGWDENEDGSRLFFLEKGRTYKGQVIVYLWKGDKTDMVKSHAFCIVLGNKEGEDPIKAIATLNLSPRVNKITQNGCQRN
jgi:hypothetical protein